MPFIPVYSTTSEEWKSKPKTNLTVPKANPSNPSTIFPNQKPLNQTANQKPRTALNQLLNLPTISKPKSTQPNSTPKTKVRT